VLYSLPKPSNYELERGIGSRILGSMLQPDLGLVGLTFKKSSKLLGMALQPNPLKT